MTRQLSEIEYKGTFGDKMNDVTDSVDDPIDIWPYVKELTSKNIVDEYVLKNTLVEQVYRNNQMTYDHILLPTRTRNNFVTIIVDIRKREVYGHYSLDLNEKYGIK